MEILLYCVAFWAICSGVGYRFGIYVMQLGYPYWFNEKQLKQDKKFARRMSVGGPINLIALILHWWFTKRKYTCDE